MLPDLPTIPASKVNLPVGMLYADAQHVLFRVVEG